MAGVVVKEGTDNGILMSLFCQLRKLIGDINAGNRRFDGTEFSAYFGWCIWFRVKRIMVGGSSIEEKHHTRRFAGSGGLLLQKWIPSLVAAAFRVCLAGML